MSHYKGYKTENTSTPTIDNWSAQVVRCDCFFVQSCQYKNNKLRSLFFFPFLFLFPPVLFPPRFSVPSRAIKRAQVFIDRLFKKSLVDMYFNKTDRASPNPPSNEIKLHSRGTSHVSVLAVFTQHALGKKPL